MKKYLFVLFSLLVMTTCMAQNSNIEQAGLSSRYWLLSVNAGAAIPAGAFGEKSFDDKSGLAKTGPALEFRVQKALGNRAGLAFALAGQYNGFDGKAMAALLDEALFYGGLYASPGPIPPQQVPYERYENWTVKKSGWWSALAQAGGYYIVFPGNQESGLIKIRGMLGAIMAKSPSIEGQSVSDTVLVTLTQKSKTGWGFSYSLGADWEKNIGRRYFLSAGVSWLGSSAIRFKDVVTQTYSIRYNPNNPPAISLAQHTGDGRQTINNLRATVGIGLHL